MTGNKTSILFLCTGNSARSILAEAIANEMFGDEIIAVSAGSKPKSQPNPLAIQTLQNHGLPTDNCRSKSWDEFKDQTFDLVVTLCGSAAKEDCPNFPGAPVLTHWGFPDPPATEDPESAFEEVFQGIMDAIMTFTTTPDYDLPAKAEIVRRKIEEG